ncbi:hypothetical protein H0H93_008669, partial [Arthromyces matolae]
LEVALREDSELKGSFYCGGVAPTAPNPCLSIEGIGGIGLPLAARDAQAIINLSARPPFGKGSKKVANRKVPDAWEIEPSKVKFENPVWTRFIHDYVISTVSKGLGVAATTVPPKCELYKLLLYEPGSHLSAHKETEKANGMFATVLIVLPSRYTGGEVHISHSTTTKVLDFAPNSLASTAILAWYTGAVHEVKPLKSGYRLALSYNLIHTTPGVPKPLLPDMSKAVSQVRQVLHKWQESAYENEELPGGYVAYLLEHKYNEANIAGGKKCLKGADAHLVTNVETIAEELGYKLYLANLEYHVTGTSYDDPYDDYRYRKRPRCGYGYDWDDDFYGGGRTTEDIESSMTLENLVDLKGSSLMGHTSISVSKANLIPKDPFQGVDPDEQDFEDGCMGSEMFEQWYHRTVLIIIHKEDVDGIGKCGDLTEYRLYRLQKADPKNLTSKDRKMADRILTSLTGTQSTTAAKIFDYTVKWKDIERWKRVIKQCGALSITVFGVEKFVEAWKVFGFEGVRQSFEDILPADLPFGTRIGFIQGLCNRATPAQRKKVEAWVEAQTKRAVSSFTAPTKEDIPMLIALGKTRGSEFLVKEILPQLTKNNPVFDFAIAFVNALHENKGSIPEHPPSTKPGQTDGAPPTNNTETMIETLLTAAAAQWDSAVTYSYSYWARAESAKVQRIISIIESCLLTGHMKTCNQLLISIIKIPGTPTQKFETLYTPLVPPLRTLMNSKKIDLCTSPFSQLLQFFVGSYLQGILGTLPPPSQAKLRKIGCENCARDFPPRTEITIASRVKASDCA